MKLQYKGEKKEQIHLMEFDNYFKKLSENATFEYLGMTVEITPYLSFTSENVLIYWEDTEEGFNDKIIFNTLSEFLKEFKQIPNA